MPPQITTVFASLGCVSKAENTSSAIGKTALQQNTKTSTGGQACKEEMSSQARNSEMALMSDIVDAENEDIAKK